MADKLKYYNVEEFNKQKWQQGKGIRIPPKANFLAAANHIRDLFESKKFTYGVLGGLEMLCLGYRREMPDFHIAYDDRDFNKIKLKLEADKRVRLPDGMNPLFPSKILVRTGPAYKDVGCTDGATIEVDLIPPGSHGTPSNGMLGKSLVLVSLKEPKLRTYKGLNMLYLVKTLVQYCKVRDLVWDPRKDILFLCQHYGEEVQSIRDQLDQKSVQENFLGTSFFSRLTPEDQRRCYHVLLGKEPPPLMAVTPPALQDGHRHSRSAPEIPRLPELSQTSSPALKINTSPALLSPPLPGKPNTSRQHAPKVEPRPTELSASAKAPSELPAQTRDSRSRYRPISAPNSRKSSPNNPQTLDNSRPKSADMPNLPTQPGASSSNTQAVGAQSLANTRMQPMSNLTPALTPAQSRKSMPNLNAGFSAPAVPFGSIQPFPANGSGPFQSQQHMTHTLPFEMSATPVPYNPGQEYLKSQHGLGGDYLLSNMRSINKPPITNNPVLPNMRYAYHGPHKARLEQSGTPKPQSQTGSLHLVSPKGEAAPLQQHVPNLEEVTSKLHLVGPEGLYQAPPKPKQPTQPSVANEPKQSSFVYELDAAPQRQSIIIAELSADIEGALQGNGSGDKSRGHPSEPMQPNVYNKSRTEELPVSTSDSHTATSQHQGLSRPPNPRTQSAPLTALPASLMVGGLSAHRPQSRTPNNSVSYTPPHTAPSQIPVTQTNASRYSRYYSPPTSAPNSSHASPQLSPAPLSVYKAYQPPSAPLPPSEVQPPKTEHTERQVRSTSFGVVQDVDGAQSYFRTHKRDRSHDSQASSASHDSSQLAQEYQAELPDFERGYGS